jgi:hypothetical protein
MRLGAMVQYYPFVVTSVPNNAISQTSKGCARLALRSGSPTRPSPSVPRQGIRHAIDGKSSFDAVVRNAISLKFKKDQAPVKAAA